MVPSVSVGIDSPRQIVKSAIQNKLSFWSWQIGQKYIFTFQEPAGLWSFGNMA